MGDVDTAELRKRIAAASAYKGYSQDTLAEKIGMSRSTYNRRLSELSEPRRRDPFLTLVAARCDLPPAFFTVDFSRLGELEQPQVPADDQAERLRKLEEQVRGIAADLELLVAEADPRSGASDVTTPGQGRQGQQR